MLHVTVLQVAATLIAILAQFSRIFAATKPFWGKLPAAAQVWLPPLLPFAAALQAQLAGVTSWTDFTVALIVSLALLMPGAPSNRSSAPLRAPQPFKPPPLTLLTLALCLGCFVLSGCAFFESKLPDAEKCLPTPAALAAQVADILAAGGDTTAALEQLAVTQTEQAVICAVKAFLGKPAASPSDSPSRARARAYLSTKGAK
jgi:hypothetical protein